ncbi:protein lifeguard 1-like [Adelges cooleyi]|uniref:protein lifeguard 1-like n=1 Tax=Adelges cooleyi TaxID=133065 RepID=UPI00218041E2|nr:protein lifeguard 1-like [Adelges cooleyi]
MKVFCATLLLVASAVAGPHHEKSPSVGQNVVPSASPSPVPYPGQVPAYPSPYQFGADFGSPFARSGFAAKAAPAQASYGAYQPYQQLPYYPSSAYSGYPTPYAAQSAYPGAYYNGYSGAGAYPYSGYPYNSYSSSAYPSGYPAFRSQFADPAVGQYSQYSSAAATPYSALPYSASPYYSAGPASHQQPSLYNQAQFQPQQYPYSPNSAAAAAASPLVANDSPSKVTAENK